MKSSSKKLTIITPKRKLFDLNIGELWYYRDLVILFVRRDFIALYKQTILGPLWFIFQPLLTTLMYTIVFARIAKISTSGLPPILFYLGGTVIWTYFSGTLTKTSETFIQNSTIFGKVYFPRLTVPVSVVLSNLIQFTIQFCLLILIIVIYAFRGLSINVSYSFSLIPFILIIIAGLGFGFGLIISALTAKYRDLKHLVTFGVQLWMYATPVIFPLSDINEEYRIYFIINPLTGVVESFRSVVLGLGDINFFHLGYSAFFMIIVLLTGVILFNKTERNFMDFV